MLPRDPVLVNLSFDVAGTASSTMMESGGGFGVKCLLVVKSGVSIMLMLFVVLSAAQRTSILRTPKY